MITYKQQEWEQIEARFYNITDKVGMRIDPGILETVVVLNALGIETSASCEGHLDHGTGAPWIDIEAISASEDVKRSQQTLTEPLSSFLTRFLHIAYVALTQRELYYYQKQKDKIRRVRIRYSPVCYFKL